MKSSFLGRIGLVVMLGISAKCWGQDWSVTTSDFQTQVVSVRGVSAAGVEVSPVDGKESRTIGMENFVSLRRVSVDPAASAAFTLSLIDGDRLVGTPGAVVKEKLTWNSPALGVMSIPLSRLARLSRGVDVSSVGEAPRQDVVTLSNGDTVAGVFMDCANSKLTIQTDTASSAIPLETVRQVMFAATGSASKVPATGFRLQLGDGSIITAVRAEVSHDQVNFTLPGKDAFSLPLAKLVGIEQLNGPVCWLSSCQPTQQVQVPYLAGAPVWPAKFDLAVDGSPLNVQGQLFDHGIGVHAYSRITFAIDPQWKFFRTQYAIDSDRSQPRRYADVTVRVLLDDKVVHEQADFKSGVLSPVVMLELGSASTLTLECDYGNTGDTQAHLDWLQAAFLRSRPAPTTVPASQPAVVPAAAIAPTTAAASQPTDH